MWVRFPADGVKLALMPASPIDSHAHLDFDAFDADRHEVLERAASVGVDRIVTVGTDLASSRRNVALAAEHERLAPSAGVHPHEAGAFDDADWPALHQLWSDPRVCAVGETGLDYHYDHSPRPRQRELFARQLRAAGEVGLPAIIHVREAYDDAFELVEACGIPAGAVLHCFTGGRRECERALALGLYISFSGIVTFPRAETIREAAEIVPAERLLIETDAPYLAPVPVRGRRNEPGHVVHTARRVAELRGVSFETLCAQTRANTLKLFARIVE